MSNISTHRLFAEPSFVEGIARVLDLGGTLQEYNDSESEAAADFEALKNDWQIVGKDINNAISQYEQEKRSA